MIAKDWCAYENNNRPFDCLVHTDKGRTPTDREVLAADDGMESFRLGGYEVDSLTDIMLGWLGEQTEQRSAQPFFAVLSVQPPHNPYTAPETEMGRHTPGTVELRANVPPVDRVAVRARRDLAGYYAAIERIDRNVGRLREKLDELGIANDTYVIFFSDHGDLHGSHGQWRKTAPWEESMRIPFVIGGPSREHQNSLRVDVPINHVDIAPTTLGLCGIAAPPTMEGFDYSSWLRKSPFAPDDSGAEPDSAYLGIPVPTYHPESVDRAWRGIVTRDNWKYVCLEGLPWLMFDLNEDPYELANLAHDRTFRAKREELHDRLERWIVDTGDSFELTR